MISFEEFCIQIPFFNSVLGKPLGKCVYRILGIGKIYEVYTEAVNNSTNGQEFIDEIYRLFGVETVVDNPEALKYFTENERFVTVSNHPYGTYDGMSLVRVVGAARPDIRGITNFILSKVKPISSNFIPVNPFEKSTSKRSSLPGLRVAMNHLDEGHPLFFFPSGQVSRIVKWFRIADREWQLPTIKLIQKSEVPIIPIYFAGHNSWRFLLIGLIHPLLRTIFIPSELLNKKGKQIHLRIGKPISVKEQKQYKDSKEFGRFLYRKTYELKNEKPGMTD